MDLTLATEQLQILQDRLGADAHRGGRVVLRLDGALAHLEFSNPTRRNAISVAMMVELAHAVRRLSESECAAVVLSSTGSPVFCAGGDLREVNEAVHNAEAAQSMALAMGTVLDTLLDLPMLSVAAVHGLAIGGGAELTTATDVRIGGAHSAFHFVHSRLGIAPGWGGAGRLVRHLGRRQALRVLCQGRRLSVGEARSVGLLDCRCDGDVLRAAVDWLVPILDAPPEAIRAIKAQVVAADPTRPAGLEVEARRFSEVWGGPAHQQALARLARHRR